MSAKTLAGEAHYMLSTTAWLDFACALGALQGLEAQLAEDLGRGNALCMDSDQLCGYLHTVSLALERVEAGLEYNVGPPPQKPAP